MKRYRYYCETDKKLEYEWRSNTPTTCVANPAHTIDMFSISVVMEKGRGIYDAIVSPYDNANYSLISEAITAGHTNILVLHGTYVEPTGFNFSGVSITGESGIGCIVYLAGQPASVRADASNGVKETAGTISIAKNSNEVVGVGTSFTNLNVGNFILIGTNYFGIAAITDDTHLTLVDTYVGAGMSSVIYTAQAMATGTHMSNILIVGSAISGLYMRGQRHFFIDSVAVKSCGNGFEFVDCGDSSARQIIAETCGGHGVIINGCVSMSFSVIDSYGHPNDSLRMLGVNTSTVFANCELTSCGGIGLNVGGDTSDVAFTNCVIKYNGSDGIYTGVNCNTVAISNFVSCHNDGMGANILGPETKLSNGCACNNVGVGVFLGGVDASCIDIISKDNTDGIRVAANDCRISLNHCKGNSLDGLHIETGVVDTIASYNNLKGNVTNNLVNNGTDSDTTGCKI